MKAKSRKRLLISSVAMLLVAMLALGTATFAWFTTDTTTKANGIAMHTTKKSVLLISDDGTKTSNWVDNFSYDFDTAVQPASSYDGTNWYTAQASSKTAKDAAENTGIKLGSTVSGQSYPMANYVFKQQLNVKNAGTVALKNVKYTFTINETKTNGVSYLRYAIVPSDSVTSLATRGSATVTAANFRAGIKSYGDTSYKAVDYVGAGTSATSGSIHESATITATAANTGAQTFWVTKEDDATDTLAAGAEKYYTIFIWYEGQDTNCFDTNAGNLFPSFDIEVTGDEVEG